MAKIPSRKFSTTKKKIESRGFPKTKKKIASRGFAEGTATIPSRKLSAAPKAEKKPEAPVVLEPPVDEKARQERVATLKVKAKLKPASEL